MKLTRLDIFNIDSKAKTNFVNQPCKMEWDEKSKGDNNIDLSGRRMIAIVDAIRQITGLEIEVEYE